MATFQVIAVVGRNVIATQTSQDALTGLPAATIANECDILLKVCNQYDWLQPGDTITVTWPAHSGPTGDPGGLQ